MSSCGPLPLCIRTAAVSLPYASEYIVGSPSASAQYAASRSVCEGLYPSTERVAHDIVMPFAGQGEQAVGTSHGVVHRLHAHMMAFLEGPDRSSAGVPELNAEPQASAPCRRLEATGSRPVTGAVQRVERPITFDAADHRIAAKCRSGAANWRERDTRFWRDLDDRGAVDLVAMPGALSRVPTR